MSERMTVRELLRSVSASFSSADLWFLGSAAIVASGWTWTAVQHAPWPADAYWTGVLASLPTGLFAVIVGIPIALRIAAIGENRNIKRQQEEAKRRKTIVLKLIRDDLSSTLGVITERNVAASDGLGASFNYQPELPCVDAELWNVLTQSGELRWFDDATLLGGLTEAYVDVKLISGYENRYYEISTYPGMISSDAPKRVVVGQLEHFAPQVRKSLENALTTIESSLTERERPKY